MNLASHISDRTGYSKTELKFINKAAKTLSKLGAVSVERLSSLIGTHEIGARWCLLHIGAIPTASGLFVWPE